MTMAKKHVSETVKVNVISRLPVKSLIRFSCVSKRWRFTIISDPKFAESQFKVASQQKTLTRRLIVATASEIRSLDLEFPWFGARGDDNCFVRNLAFPIPLKPKNPNQNFMVMGSCNGLICIALDYRENYFIWNPSTGVLQKLPDPNFGSENIQTIYCHGFGYVSETDDYKVVVAAELNDDGTEDPVEVFSLRACSWKSVEAPPTLPMVSRGALSNEALHWVDNPIGRSLIAFDLAKEEFREVALPMFNEGRMVFFKEVRVLLDGCLCVWSIRELDCEEIWVMREYNVRESWTLLYKFNIPKPTGQVYSIPNIFFRESGIVLNVWVQEGTFEYMEFTWFDKKEDKLDKDVVFSGQYTLFGINSSVNVTEYVESLHPLLSNISDEPPPPVAPPVTHIEQVPVKASRTKFTLWKSLFRSVLKKLKSTRVGRQNCNLSTCFSVR